ncbi:MAG: hypothetical protein AVDCRST_MAG15-1483, partial [uncultured Rubellimicrobium sp.]
GRVRDLPHGGNRARRRHPRSRRAGPV